MGQRMDRELEPRIEYDENSDNGLVLCDVYIPEELISEILCYVDYKSLLKCQVVCKRWNVLTQDYVWRKKAEMSAGQSLQSIKKMPWYVHYSICNRKPFGRNLVKNHSGKNGLSDWQITGQGGDHWKVEKPPVGVAKLPSEPVFEGQESCFVTSYYNCTKLQIIDLVAEGLSPKLMDECQLEIEIGEWYSCRWDCPAVYECIVTLLGEENTQLDAFHFHIRIADDNQNQWHHISHVFENYGPGLRKICFQHGGKDSLFWAGHYGSKMAGASVIVKVPKDKDSPPPPDIDMI